MQVSPSNQDALGTSTGVATGYSTCAPDAFPDKWMKGVGLSVFQNSPDPHAQWTEFIKKRNYFGQPNPEAWSKSNDFWNEYAGDIKMAKGLGITSFRFSFEWSRLWPLSPDKLDQAAVDRYNQILDCMEEHGLEPNATIHHFTHPVWFEASGGFANVDNIPVFANYATCLWRLFHKRIRMWATLNEPTCFAFVGHIIGLWCPGDFLQFSKAGAVLLNLLRCHVAAYKSIKKEPDSQHSAVGLVHQHIKFWAKNSVPYCTATVRWMTYWFGSDIILKFFTTGIFTWEAPIIGQVISFEDRDAPSTLDWWGINYYSNPVMDWKFQMTTLRADEDVTDIKFRIYPQGLYDSIKNASVLKVPIFITETGLADKNSIHRSGFVKSHYGALLKALKDGFDVRGCYWWTLMDNIEWHEGFHVKYGLFEWDPVVRRTAGPLKMRPGGETLIATHAAWPNDLEELRRYAQQQPDIDDIVQGIPPSRSPSSGINISAEALEKREQAPLIG